MSEFFNLRSVCSHKGVDDRFNESHITMPETGCWEWIGSIDSRGYGQMMVDGKLVLAHRLSMTMHNSDPIENMCVCHKCDNKTCVNPEHLFIGTHKDNAMDMVKKGRAANSAGTNNSGHKLSEDDVISIRLDARTLVEIAKSYGVGKSSIGNIKTRKTWRHI